MSLFDPGKKDRRAAAALAQEGIIRGGSATGPGGISAGFNFSGGRGSIESSLGSFAPALEGLQGLGAAGIAQAQGGLPSDFTGLAGATQDRLGQINVNQLQNQSDFAGLGDIFQSSLGTAQADPFDLGSEISERLRALSERRNQRTVNKTFDRLKASGKLGTTGGANIAGELDRNLTDQAMQFDLAGLQAGQGIQQAAFQRALQASGQREAIGGRQFSESFGLEQLGGQRALQQFGVGDQTFQNFLANQAQGANIGIGATGAGSQLSTLPLAFLQASQGAAGQASNSLFAAAGVNQQNASMAKSPFLEALNAVGTFAGNIKPDGF